jgi:hypothetical protein
VAATKLLPSYTKPYYAENADMHDCLQALYGTPLKLVVDSLWSRPDAEEVPWVQPRWAFGEEAGKIVKPAFIPPKDVFQFSVADARSRQDWHYHQYVYEMYVSSQPMHLEYQEQPSGPVHSVTVNDGFLLIPPGLNHKITLTGMTYVFQVTLAEGGGIGKDKIVAPV